MNKISLALIAVALTAISIVSLAPKVSAASIYHSSDPYENYIINWESSGRSWAVNPYSGACGLMQAWPCSKLANVCPAWYDDVQCQLDFFTTYAAQRYGTWYGAYVHEIVHGWW